MSWSINLSGPQNVVARELADAILLLDKAIDWAQNSSADSLTVSLGGYATWADNDITSSNVSFSVSENYNPREKESESS